jgi:hypothetical protein
MEEDIQARQVSPVYKKSSERVEHRLERAVEQASERINYESAHDESLLHALSVVNTFIKRKKRVCYGGTAMNMILPEKKRFYDPNTDLPDYDFYTPDVEGDIEELVKDLKAEGYEDVYHKVGIHAGTKKILVNFIAVADITGITPELFAIMYRRSIKKDGVHYTDPDVLRMMMYLELSRPRGMVERWPKVFERLQLINQEFPIKAGCSGGGQWYESLISTDVRKTILDYCIQHQRILCNGPLASIYSKGIRQGGARYELRKGGPLLFTSPEPKDDAAAVKALLDDDRLVLYKHPERGELVPLRIEVRMGDKPICMFIEETACHSLNQIPLGDGRKINIASLELLITLYLSIDIFTNHSRDYLGEKILCQVKKFIELSEENYRAVNSQFPAFSQDCQGHQIGFASLLRAKVERVKAEKEELEKKLKRAKRKAARERAKAKASGTRKASARKSSTRKA